MKTIHSIEGVHEQQEYTNSDGTADNQGIASLFHVYPLHETEGDGNGSVEA